MKVVKATIEDIEGLKPLAFEWRDSCNAKDLDIDLDRETFFAGLADLIERDDADTFLLLNEKDTVVGYMGAICFPSPLGKQRICSEHYWFVSGKNRGRGTLLLLRAVENWAKEKGCNKFIMTASCLASNMHDRLCKFYERIGFQKFETSYIKGL